MKDIPFLLDSLQRTPGVLTPLVQSIPKEFLHLRRGEGFWTIAEHVWHLADLEPLMLKRVQSFVEQDNPQFVGYTPPEDITTLQIDVDQTLATYANRRKDLMALLPKLTPEIWSRKGVHPRFITCDCRIMVRHILTHDYWHMHRISALWLLKDEFQKPVAG
jgi:uncharacterized damage-inducible protein DinB